LAVRTLGTSGSPIVFLHGLAASGSSWGAAYDRLAGAHRLVFPDLLGFGRSPRPRSGYGPDDHANAVAKCLHEIGAVDEPALLVGHSLGSLIALRMAAIHPELVAGVVGFGPPIAPTREAISRRWRHCDRPAGITAALVQHARSSYRETVRRVVLAAAAPTWLEATTAPVQLIIGSEDTVPDLAFVQALSTRLPNVTTAVWPHADHEAPLLFGAACRLEIEDFLALDRARA
jgi:pimeloyl-ACP methyl ester carboxylesterase